MLNLSRLENDATPSHYAAVARTLAQLSQGQTADDHKLFLRQYMARWCLGGERITMEQSASVLATLGIPYEYAEEVFRGADSSLLGHVSIADLCNAIVGTCCDGEARPARPVSARCKRQTLDPLERSSRRPLTAGCRRLAAKPSPYFSCDDNAWDEYMRPFSMSVGLPTMNLGSHSNKHQHQHHHHHHGRSRDSKREAAQHVLKTMGTMKAANPEELEFSNVVVEKFRQVILDRGGAHGIHALGRVFKILDDDGNRRVSLEELRDGLDHFGLNMNKKDLRVLIAATDKDGSGSLSFAEFINTVRGPICKRRLDVIDMAFDKLDVNKKGYVTVDSLSQIFNPASYVGVLQGDVSARQGLEHFISQFDVDSSDGKVTRKEFQEYYQNVSASIDDDDHFELMIRNAWHLAGGKGHAANTANARLLVKLTDGTEKVVTLESDLGLNLKDFAAVKAQLKRQGVVNVATFSRASRM